MKVIGITGGVEEVKAEEVVEATEEAPATEEKTEESAE